jgi:hypothetical protein
MAGFERFCWAVTALASIAAAALLGTAFFGHGLGAPQETAFAAVGVAVIPYVFTRAIQAMGRSMRHEAAAAYPPAVQPERREVPAPAIPETPAEPEPRRAGIPRAEPPTAERRRAGLFRAKFPPREPDGTEPSTTESSRPETEQAEPVFAPATSEPVREPLVARERLVEPPPKQQGEGMGRLFWILVGILVVLLLVGGALVMSGP